MSLPWLCRKCDLKFKTLRELDDHTEEVECWRMSFTKEGKKEPEKVIFSKRDIDNASTQLLKWLDHKCIVTLLDGSVEVYLKKVD